MRGVTPKNARSHSNHCKESPRKWRDGPSPVFLNNSISDIIKVRVLTVHEGHSVGRGDSSHFPHIYNSTKTGGAGIVCSSVMVVPRDAKKHVFFKPCFLCKKKSVFHRKKQFFNVFFFFNYRKIFN